MVVSNQARPAVEQSKTPVSENSIWRKARVVEEPGLPVGSGKRRRQTVNPALEKAADGQGPEPVADLLQANSVPAGGEPVVQGDIRDPRLFRLALGVLMAVAADPHGEGGIAADLDECWSELRVVQVEVGKVREDTLAGELEVGMAIGSPISPGAVLLLSDARQHDAEATLRPGLREVRRGICRACRAPGRLL